MSSRSLSLACSSDTYLGQPSAMCRLLLLACCLLIPTPICQGNEKFEAYKKRRADRRAAAQRIKVDRAQRRPPAVYRTAVVIQVQLPPHGWQGSWPARYRRPYNPCRWHRAPGSDPLTPIYIEINK